MAESAEIETPTQPPGERALHIAFWIVFGLASTAVMLIDSPYNLRDQSTIMVKGEIVARIKDARNTFKGWPLDETDARFAFGTLAKNEHLAPSFRILTMGYDPKDHKIERTVYSFDLRGSSQEIVIRYNPGEITKKRLF